MASNTNPVANPIALFQTPLVDTQAGRIQRNWYPFFTNVQQLLASSYLPVFNAGTFGADPQGQRDSSAPIMAAYAAAVSAGGGTIYIGPGTYTLLSPIVLNSQVPVTFLGAGIATFLQRGANMPQGMGVWDLQAAQNVTFSSFLMDGATTVPAKIAYSQLAPSGYDPMNPLLAANSSFWLHDGCNQIAFNEITVQHTGGYSVVAQAVNQDITNLYFYRLHLLNNRSTCFGLTSAAANFGSWTGGVLFQGNGISSTAMIRHARFLECDANRVTGNAFWQHLYGYTSLHEDVQFSQITGLDIGRDLIQPGGVCGMKISGVVSRRGGYIALDDTSEATPAWQSGEWAVAIDCGTCYGLEIDDVIIVSQNGGGIDIDGCERVTLGNFNIRVPLPTDFEYVPDQIGLVGWAGATTPGGPNAAYGILMAQASYNVMGEGGHQIGNGQIVNCSNGAIKIYSSQNNNVSNVNIVHPAANTGAPISIGNSVAGYHSTGNVIGSTVRVQYSPATPRPCVFEDGSVQPFVATDINYVLGVVPVDPTGNATAFSKDVNSGSIGSVTAALTSPTTLDFTDGFLTGHS